MGSWNASGREKNSKIKPSCLTLPALPSLRYFTSNLKAEKGWTGSKPRAELTQRGDSQNLCGVLHQAHKTRTKFTSGLHLPLQVKFSLLSCIANRGSQPQELFWLGRRGEFPV